MDDRAATKPSREARGRAKRIDRDGVVVVALRDARRGERRERDVDARSTPARARGSEGDAHRALKSVVASRSVLHGAFARASRLLGLAHGQQLGA